jgi:hypothetical protein
MARLRCPRSIDFPKEHSLRTKSLVGSSAAFLAIVLFACTAQAGEGTRLSNSVRDFVQNFYNWYVPYALGDKTGLRPWDIAISSKRNFDPRLVQALQEDSTASDKFPNEIVGLDFDPFLNSQNPADRYRAEKVDEQNGSFLVEVYSVSGSKKELAVIAEVKKLDGKLIFVNFRYPDVGGDRSNISAERTRAKS